MKNNQSGPKNNGESAWYALARFMGLGLEVAVAIVLSLYVGYKLDQRFGYSPLFLIVCLVLGFAVSINILLSYSRAAQKLADKNKRGKENKG